MAGYHMNGSDRVVEQHQGKYGKLLLWVEAHKMDEQGNDFLYPRWLFWFQMADDLFDVYVHDVMFDTKEAAMAACNRLIAILQ